MKKLLLVTWICSLALGVDYSTYGQGTMVFNNLGPSDGKVFVFNEFWTGNGRLLDQDLNFVLSVFYRGEPVFERSWLLSDGTAKGINVGPGLFADPSRSVIELPGIAPGTGIQVRVEAWAGEYDTLLDAGHAGAGFGLGGGFMMGAGSAEVPPTSLDGMPDLDVRGVPEPSTWALFGCGAFALMLGWRRVSHPMT